MTLQIQRIELHGFRNSEHLDVEPAPGITVIVGPNAAGKTNLIEAIQLVTAATSFRNPSWGETVMWDRDSATVRMVAAGEGRHLETAMTTTREGRRTYRVNGVLKKKVADVAGLVPAVLFTPDDLRMLKDSADRRRRALDEIGEQLSSAYREIVKEYDRAVRQRNAVLKEQNRNEGVLASWTERVVEVGSALAIHRMRLFTRLEQPTREAYAELAGGEELTVAYRSSWWKGEGPPDSKEEAAEALTRELADQRSSELARGITLAGPHRDDVAFSIAGHDARAYGSQGQQRSAALAWKMAEVAVVEDVTGREPVLLLDDVMSELDEGRRHALARSAIGRAQTFITTTNLGYFGDELLEHAEVVSLGA